MKGSAGKGKAPAFQFYVKDWRADAKLRMCHASTRGIWIDMLCDMWECQGCSMTYSIEGLQRAYSISAEEAQLFIDEAMEYEFCDLRQEPEVTTHKSGNSCDTSRKFTFMSRRLNRDSKIRAKARERKRRQRSRDAEKKSVTPPSQKRHPVSSTATSTAGLKNSKRGTPDPTDKDLRRRTTKRPSVRIPDRFTLNDTRIEYAVSVGIAQQNVASVMEDFRDYALREDRRCADWDAAWRTWCRKEMEFNKARHRPIAEGVGWRQKLKDIDEEGALNG